MSRQKQFISSLAFCSAMFGLWHWQGGRLSNGTLSSWGMTLTQDQHDSRVERARDAFQRAERMTENARDMLAKARGLAQHRFWNQRIDEFTDDADKKREAYRLATEARDEFTAGQALMELQRQDAEERRLKESRKESAQTKK